MTQNTFTEFGTTRESARSQLDELRRQVQEQYIDPLQARSGPRYSWQVQIIRGALRLIVSKKAPNQAD